MSTIKVTNVHDTSNNVSLVTDNAGIKTDKLTGNTTAGSISVVGEGNSNTTNLQQGLLKQHASVQGTDTFGAIDSFNCGSVTDHATGDHSITASSAFRDSRACALGTTHNTANEGSSAAAANDRGGTNISGNGGAAPTTTVFRFVCHTGSSSSANGAAVDLSYVYVARLGDLA